MEDTNKLSFFFLGLGLGVAIGILFAPKSGQETREFIKSKAGEGQDYVKRKAEDLRESAGGAIDKGRAAFVRQRDRWSSAVEAGKQAYREAVGESPEAGQPAPESNA